MGKKVFDFKSFVINEYNTNEGYISDKFSQLASWAKDLVQGIKDGLVKMNWPEYMNSRSQDLPGAFHDCGQFYFIKVENFLKHNNLFTEFTVPFEMPESEVQDIDNEEDWKVAEIKYTFLLEKVKSENV